MKHTMHRGSRHQKTIFCVPIAIALLALLGPTTASPGVLAKTGELVVPAISVNQIGSAQSALRRTPRHAHAESKTIIDLSYPLNNKTLHWPTNSGFSHTVDRNGTVPLDKNETIPFEKNGTIRSYYVLSDSFCTAVHSGTHLDAPAHFNLNGWTVDKIPLERLIDVPLTVIDLSEKVTKNRTYAFLKDDFIDKKSNRSLVKAGSVVLVYTGVSNSYNQGAKAYFGTDSKNVGEMSIPGFSPEAANFLVSQKVYGVGLDSPSADLQRNDTNATSEFQAHTILTSNNIYILENISGNLSLLVNSKSARLTIAPLPIENGSGSPVRLIASTGHDEKDGHVSNSAKNGPSQIRLFVTILLILGIVPFTL